MGLEYYYLFGLDIPLDEFKLSTLRNPTLRDLIESKKSIEPIYMPFLYNDILVGKTKEDKKNTTNELIKKLGSLKFLIAMSLESNNVMVIKSLLDSISFLYNTKDVEIKGDMSISVNKDIVIDNSNFDTLSAVVLEMFKIDKSKIKFDEPEDTSSGLITKEMLEAKRKYLERNKGKKKDDGLTIIDISNVLIHSGLFSYAEVLDLTIYQIKNSFEVICKKESNEVGLLHRISPKFDTGKDKYEHWTEKIKLDKSSLSRND